MRKVDDGETGKWEKWAGGIVNNSCIKIKDYSKKEDRSCKFWISGDTIRIWLVIVIQGGVMDKKGLAPSYSSSGLM